MRYKTVGTCIIIIGAFVTFLYGMKLAYNVPDPLHYADPDLQAEADADEQEYITSCVIGICVGIVGIGVGFALFLNGMFQDKKTKDKVASEQNTGTGRKNQ